MKTAGLYVLFAGVAIMANIVAQYLGVLLLGSDAPIFYALAIGTISGLIIKYLLDKYYIFQFREVGRATEGRMFLLYAFFGLFTTVLFWGIEFGFDLWFSSESMRYVGAVLGLSMGYFLKYRLDKKYVFV